MKRIIIAMLAVLPIAGCQKKPITEESAPPAEREVAPVPSTPPAAVIPAAPAPIVAATPAPELAPPGVFYLITAARVETSEGITGLAPGAGLRLLRPGVYQSEAGEVALRADQVTNNLAIARQVSANNANAQAALRALGSQFAREANSAAAERSATASAQEQATRAQDSAAAKVAARARRNVLYAQDKKLKDRWWAIDQQRNHGAGGRIDAKAVSVDELRGIENEIKRGEAEIAAINRLLKSP